MAKVKSESQELPAFNLGDIEKIVETFNGIVVNHIKAKATQFIFITNSPLQVVIDGKIVSNQKINISEDFNTDNFYFIYKYNTAENETVNVKYTVTYEWIKDQKLLGIDVDKNLLKLVIYKPNKELSEQLKQLITLFYQKIEAYFKKTNNIMLGDSIATKVIRETADNFNQKEEIILKKSELLSRELDDLFK